MTRSFPFARWMLPARAPAYLALLALALAFSLPARPSLSHEVEIDGRKISFDPAQIRYITPMSASSTCVGELREPLCAIETQIGCDAGIATVQSFCQLMSYPPSKPADVRVEYVVLKSGMADLEKMDEILTKEEYEEFGIHRGIWRGSFQARVLERTCSADQRTCDGTDWNDSEYDVIPDTSGPYMIWKNSSRGIYQPDNWFALSTPGAYADGRNGEHGRRTPADTVDPADIRFATNKDASSNCIGDLRLPLCAIETAIVCDAHRPLAVPAWESACHLLGLDPLLTPSRPDRVEYAVIESGFVNIQEAGKAISRVVKAVQDGIDEVPSHSWLRFDTYQARVLRRFCDVHRPSCRDPWGDASLFIAYPVEFRDYVIFRIREIHRFKAEDWFVDQGEPRE